jgi:hypothetical protein
MRRRPWPQRWGKHYTLDIVILDCNRTRKAREVNNNPSVRPTERNLKTCSFFGPSLHWPRRGCLTVDRLRDPASKASAFCYLL